VPKIPQAYLPAASSLRNAAVDQFRRRGAADRAYETVARELDIHEAPNCDMEREICARVTRLAATLKPNTPRHFRQSKSRAHRLS
jgi:hypothetical protein